MDDQEAISALLSDLHWQIDQLPVRGIKDAAGNPYNPSYFKRGLQAAIDKGGWAVAEYVRRYVYNSPSDGYRKLEDADSLDLTCEALVADAEKPYADLFTEADRKSARTRLGSHIEVIEVRRAGRRQRVEELKAQLPENLDALRALAAATAVSEEAIAINEAIISRDSRDIAALNRLGRAYVDIGSVTDAEQAFNAVLKIDPNNRVAHGRLNALFARRRARQRAVGGQ